MIIGAHSIIYSKSPDLDRAFLQDTLKLPGVDVGGGWMILGLPPAEVAVHPAEKNDIHELYFMVDDVAAFMKDMERRSIRCGPVQNQGWGLLTSVTLPGGGKLGFYQPRHARPPQMRVGKPPARSAKRRKKPAPRKPARSKAKRR
jgi:hypothetical protein